MEAALTRRPAARAHGPARGAPAAAGLFLAASLSLAAALSAPAELPPKQADLLAKLRARVQAVDARLDGVLGVYVRDLSTGSTVELRPDEVFPTASSIKLAVLYELYRQAEEGRVDLMDLVAPPPHPVPGEGVLRFMAPRTRLTLRDVGLLVMSLSDNEGANELIRRVGLENVNLRLDSLSLRSTRLRRLMMDLEAARQGRENVSTPREMARMAEIVGRGEGLSPELASDLLIVATVLDGGSYFRKGLPEDQVAVSKSGTLEGIRCEAAWVDLKGRPYSAAVMTTYLRSEADGEAAIAEISAAVYATFDRLARSSEHGRLLGSGR